MNSIENTSEVFIVPIPAEFNSVFITWETLESLLIEGGFLKKNEKIGGIVTNRHGFSVRKGENNAKTI